MKPCQLRAGDVVQISPENETTKDGFFAGCFMLVTEPKSFGAMGFIAMPGERGTPPGQAYYRCKFEDMELIGRGFWIADPNTPPNPVQV